MFYDQSKKQDTSKKSPAFPCQQLKCYRVFMNKLNNTLFLKYVLHLWYSLMTISILLFQHFPSAEIACKKDGDEK